MRIEEGYMPYLGHRTYYRIAVPEHTVNAPLVLLHGGPGSTHNYCEVLDSIADSTDRAVISYDQIGCGNSYLDGEPSLWKAETWVNELKALREHLGLESMHLLGQSWGGMLALLYLLDEKPAGVKSVILSSTLSSSRLWAHEQHRLISFMSAEDQAAIAAAEKTGNFTDKAYLKANDHFMTAHCAGAFDETAPECLRRPKKSGAEAYLYAWGPNEYSPTGTLRDYDVTDRLHELDVPALIMSGTNDLCTPLVAKTMFDNIPNSEWHLFDGARHMCFVEKNKEYCEVLSKWLIGKDKAIGQSVSK